MIVPVHNKTEDFHWLQLFGFVFLVIGTLVFNEIVIFRFFRFDENTKVALAIKENEKSEQGKSLVEGRDMRRDKSMNASTVE